MMNDKLELPNMDNILLSGGAEGADYQFGKYAFAAGHGVIHWTFAGHKSKCPPQHIVVLEKDLLLKADKFVINANKTLKRKFPSRYDDTNNLLRRNYYQVKDTQCVYAIGKFKDGQVSGGTAWAVEMYKNRFLIDMEPFDLCKLYLYDQENSIWMKWVGVKGWEEIDIPPAPTGIYTGIGTREIEPHGIEAIKSLFRPSNDA